MTLDTNDLYHLRYALAFCGRYLEDHSDVDDESLRTNLRKLWIRVNKNYGNISNKPIDKS